MKVYNQDKTKELKNYDLTKGFLQDAKLYIRTEPEVKEIEEEGHWETIKEYPNGGKDVEWIIDKEGQSYIPPKDIYEDIQIYIPYTKEELLNIELRNLMEWFEEYDNQVKQYERCVRLNIEFDKDINELDRQATENQYRIREIRSQL